MWSGKKQKETHLIVPVFTSEAASCQGVYTKRRSTLSHKLSFKWYRSSYATIPR